MVSVIPPKRGFGDYMADTLAQFSRNLPNVMEERFQKERADTKIDEFKKKLDAAGGDINQILPEIAKLVNYVPGLERSGYVQHAIERATQQQQPGALTEGAGAISRGGYGDQNNLVDQNLLKGISQETQQPQPETAQISPEEGKKSAQNIETTANQYLGEIRPDLVNPSTQYGAINTFDSAIKQDLTPDEESRVRQQLTDRKYPPKLIDSVVDRLRQSVATKYKEAQDRYSFDQDKLNQIKDKWSTFVNGSNGVGGAKQRLAPHLEKYTDDFPKTKEVLTNKYLQYAGASPTNQTPEQMHTNAMALLQGDIQKLDALNAIPAMPPIRTADGAAEYINSNKAVYKDLADRGFTDALKEDAILNKDMGNEEFHSLIWGDQTNKPFLNSLHGIEAPKEYKQMAGAPPGHPSYNKEYPKQREKYIKDLTSTLKKIGPKDDLILSRAMVLDSGGDLKDFNTALDNAMDEGLKLSEFQRSQLQETRIPRTPPLWEIFSGAGESEPGVEAVFGISSMLNWRPFINYLRGKK